jgi:hypothetical protein
MSRSRRGPARSGCRPPECARRRRRIKGQDDAGECAPCRGGQDDRSASSSSRIRGSVGAPLPTWWHCAQRTVSPRCPISSARRCDCAWTASRSARCAALRRLTCLKALGHRPSRRSGNVVVGQQLGYVARAFRLKTITAQNAGNKLHYEPVFAANVNKGDADSCSSPASARAGERRVPEPQFNASRAIPRTRSSRSRRILARCRTAVSCRSR